MGIKYRKTAFKWGCTKEQIEQVLADLASRPFELHDDEHGNPQEMIVGYTQAEVLLEIGIAYLEDDDSVFHAKKASAEYKQMYLESR